MNCQSSLVGGVPLKNMKVSRGYYSQYIESHRIPWFQSPPPRTCCRSKIFMQKKTSDDLT